VKAPNFSYARAATVEEACVLLARHGDNARILAGGQSLMPTLNMRLSAPELLIDINRIEALRGIAIDNDIVRIGALVRHAELAESVIIKRHLPLLAEAIQHVAHPAVRNRGTFGGSISLADPAAELPACAVALNASLVLVSRRGPRIVAAEHFFKGLYETERRPDEILTEARIPAQKPGAKFGFAELARRHGDFAIVGLACIEAGSPRLVFFGCEDRPRLAREAAKASGVAAVQAALARDLKPMSNLQGSAATKLHLARVLAGRVLSALQTVAA
jgi:carbon-monoxide dehydrogenase medium subunit